MYPRLNTDKQSPNFRPVFNEPTNVITVEKPSPIEIFDDLSDRDSSPIRDRKEDEGLDR